MKLSLLKVIFKVNLKFHGRFRAKVFHNCKVSLPSHICFPIIIFTFPHICFSHYSKKPQYFVHYSKKSIDSEFMVRVTTYQHQKICTSVVRWRTAVGHHFFINFLWQIYWRLVSLGIKFSRRLSKLLIEFKMLEI